MTTRICRLIGVAFGSSTDPVELTVTFNGVTVFDGAVVTRDGEVTTTIPWNEHDILCSWNFTQDLDTMPDGCSHGIPLDVIDTDMPVSISVRNGTLQHQGIVMNNRGSKTKIEFVENPQWATYTPENPAEFEMDVQTLGFHGFETKYGLPWPRASEFIREIILAPPSETFFGFGPKQHTNWTIDGEPVVDNPKRFNPSQGPRHFQVFGGSTLTYTLKLTSPKGLNFDGL